MQEKIHTIRNKKVMLDRDLAELYGVETRALNQAVKRNKERFPEDFYFKIDDTNLKSQSVISSWGGTRKPIFAFTQEGVAMLSSVLKSKVAIEININIIRAFVQMNSSIKMFYANVISKVFNTFL